MDVWDVVQIKQAARDVKAIIQTQGALKGENNLEPQETTENYLETIYILKNKLGRVRSIDISNKLNYSKPTVSIKMKQLRDVGYVEIDDDGFIVLTDEGYFIAEKIYERHNIIAEMLMALGVDKETALIDSCKIEHDISEKTFECIKAHYPIISKK